MSIEDFPQIVETKKRSAVAYFLSKFMYTKSSDKDYLGLDRVEDLLKGETDYIIYMIEMLYNDGRKIEAKGVYMRHNIRVTDFGQSSIGRSKQGIARDLENMNYDPAKDYKTKEDMFEPVSTPNKDYLRLPVDMLVEFIGKEKDI